MSMQGAIAVAKLIQVLDCVQGRKRLQKVVHLLQASGAREFNHRFALHYFGPFSRELAHEIDLLADTQLVSESRPKSEGESYQYRLVESKLETVEKLYADEFGKPAWERLARDLNKEDTQCLEAMSTLVYLAERGTKFEQLEENFKKVKPHLHGEFEVARKRATELGLLRTH